MSWVPRAQETVCGRCFQGREQVMGQKLTDANPFGGGLPKLPSEHPCCCCWQQLCLEALRRWWRWASEAGTCPSKWWVEGAVLDHGYVVVVVVQEPSGTLRLPSTELRQSPLMEGEVSVQKKPLSLLFGVWAGSEQVGSPEWWLLLWMDMRQVPVAVIWC